MDKTTSMNIQEYLRNNSWSIQQSRGDGHCLLYSVCSSWNNQFRNQPVLDYHKLKSEFYIETITNVNIYSSFLVPATTSNLIHGLKHYVLHKRYNQSFGDIAPLIVSNTLNIDLNIVNERNDSTVQQLTVHSSNGKPSVGHLNIHRKADHFNGLVFNDSASVVHRKPTSDRKVYSSQELKSMRNDYQIKRSTRKLLFRYDIWNGKSQLASNCFKSIPVRVSKRQDNVNRISDCLTDTTIYPDVYQNIDVVISKQSESKSNHHYQHDFRQLQKVSKASLTKPKLLDMCLLNTRSVRNKAHIVKDFVIDNSCDIMALTETWLKKGDEDSATVNDLCPKTHKLPHKPRSVGRGGGVGLLHRDTLKIKEQATTDFRSFEYTECVFKATSKTIRLIVLYRPPPSSVNKLTPIFIS